MDPVALILTALAAGAALGAKDTASSAVKDAYNGLKALVKKRLAGRSGGELVLAHYEEAPGTWKGLLTAELAAAGAGDDASLVAAAQTLMKLIDDVGSKSGKYVVTVRDSQAVQVGDGNTQTNTFGAGPSLPPSS